MDFTPNRPTPPAAANPERPTKRSRMLLERLPSTPPPPPKRIPFLFWDATAHRWGAPPPPPPPPAPPAALAVLTFNVFFGMAHWEARCDAVLEVLQRRRPDVVCLQEVRRPFLRRIMGEAFVRAGYGVTEDSVPHDAVFDDDYGVVLLVRRGLGAAVALQHQLPSAMSRSVLIARLAAGAVVATTHLESQSRDLRRSIQLRAIQALLLPLGKSLAVLAGDFNFCARGEEQHGVLDAQWRDAWDAAAGDPGFTKDPEANAMLARHQQPQRVDRVLYCGAWTPTESALEGVAAIAPGVFPSDHFGVFTRLKPS